MTKFDTAMELICQMQDKELAEKHEKEKIALRVKQFEMAKNLSDLLQKYPDMETQFMKCFK